MKKQDLFSELIKALKWFKRNNNMAKEPFDIAIKCILYCKKLEEYRKDLCK